MAKYQVVSKFTTEIYWEIERFVYLFHAMNVANLHFIWASLVIAAVYTEKDFNAKYCSPLKNNVSQCGEWNISFTELW